MKPRNLIALTAAVGVLAGGTACAKNQDKLTLINTLDRSSHTSGVFRYTDETPATALTKGRVVAVRGLVEDDFRYKARLSIDAADVLDEVVNDDALAVRFLDPSYVSKFTSSGGKPDTLAALDGRYWVYDPNGAPAIGDAAVKDSLLGADPIVDSLSVVAYVKDAIAQSRGVVKFNAEQLDYRPAEDPFPRPGPGSGVVRWDLVPAPVPQPDAAGSGDNNTNLARANVFRKMSIYVKGNRVVQVREKIGAEYDLLAKFRNYIERLVEKAGGKGNLALKAQAEALKDKPEELSPFLNFVLNIALKQSGEDAVRFRTMTFEFARQGEKVRADLPSGSDVKLGALDIFGANATAKAKAAATSGSTTTTTPATSDTAGTGTETPTTTAP